MYLANKPHDPQKLPETSFQVILDSLEFDTVFEVGSRSCSILIPKLAKDPNWEPPK